VEKDKYSNIADTYDYMLLKNIEREMFSQKYFKIIMSNQFWTALVVQEKI